MSEPTERDREAAWNSVVDFVNDGYRESHRLLAPVAAAIAAARAQGRREAIEECAGIADEAASWPRAAAWVAAQIRALAS